MKYYDKKRAAHGWWSIGLGVLWIAVAAQEYEIWFNWIVSGIFIVGGIWDLVRARTKKLTEEERIELTDERNQMLLLQTKSRAYDIMNVLDVVLMMIFIVLGKYWDISAISFVGIGIGIVGVVTSLAQSITYSYYNEI